MTAVRITCSGVIRIGLPVWKWKSWKILGTKWLKGMQMVQIERPRHWNPSVSTNFRVRWVPFSHYWSSGVIRIGLPVWKWKSWKILGTKWLKGMQMVKIVRPRHSNPSVSSNFTVGWIPFSHYWTSGVIRIGLPVWKWKSWNILGTKVA